MGSSNRKKNEKAKDFKKAKLRVGKGKPQASNFTDTSFKSKAIVVNQQSLSETAPDPVEQFKHNLSLASSSRSDTQRKEALAYLTTQLSLKPPNNPVGTSAILTKLLPLITDQYTSVRTQLLKLLRALPPAEVSPDVEKALMYVRAGMTHLSSEIRTDTLSVLDWLLDSASDEAVSCPGGWMKTLNSFSAMLGWNPSIGNATDSKGWTTASKATLGATKGGNAQARQIQVLARFLQAGFKPDAQLAYDPQAFWDNIYRLPRRPNPFAYLNLFGPARDEEGEMYPDRESRQRVFHSRWSKAIGKGLEEAKKEGGAVGRAAAVLDQTLKDGMGDYKGGMEP
ncbi:Rix1 complex component [Coniochaeta sp. 2T2.1]|nr:Rix1 complex component [Coniochaeta sp. 2T2.1]